MQQLASQSQPRYYQNNPHEIEKAAFGTPYCLGNLKLDYEYKTEYEYDYRLPNQRRFQSPRSLLWF